MTTEETPLRGSCLEYLNSLPEATTVLEQQHISFLCDGLTGWVVMHTAHRSVNIIDSHFLNDFTNVMDVVMEAARSKRILALVFASDKTRSFVAGADIDSMFGNTDFSTAKRASRACQDAFCRIERVSVPTIAAMDGAALGGGLELALACTYRVCGDHAKVTMGLPEVKLGLIPGGGGTVRLPKLIGLQAALQVILPGGAMRPAKALRTGLVDAVLPSTDQHPKQYRFLTAVQDFAGRVYNTPARRPYLNRMWTGSLQDRLLNGTSLGHYIVARTAASNLDKDTHGKYPAPYQALESIMHSLSLPLCAALKVEALNFAKCAVSPQSKALMGLFLMTEDAKRYGKHIPGAPEVQRPDMIGVIGAGVMGAQIAALAAGKNIRVYMRDINAGFVEKGMQHVREHFERKVQRGRMTREDAERHVDLVSGGVDIEGFRDCDLLIEAAVERMDLKKRIVAECEGVISPSCVFATNTSSLSITELAASSQRPDNIVGLHFFNPVHRMPLVEVIRGAQTSPKAMAISYSLALALGKIPVICGDCPGFVVNRVLGIYMAEAGKLLLEGHSILDIDRALLAFGMPMGPFRLIDEVGLDVAAHVAPVLEHGLGERYAQDPQYAAILSKNPSTLGKKTGAGFFLYDERGHQLGANADLLEQIALLVKSDASSSTPRRISDRCVLVMLNEACYILDEGIVNRPADLDLAMVMGTGFAPFYGGLFAYADRRGIKNVVARMCKLSKAHGKRFDPHPLLQRMVREKKRFFPERPHPASLKKPSSNPRSRL